MKRSALGLVASFVALGVSANCGSSNSPGGGGGSGSGGASSGGGSEPPSCQAGGPGMTNCGSNSESCCTSLAVAGGTFFRAYDPPADPGQPYGPPELEADGGAAGEADPATVSAFRLDKYEVTVGRFRQFVNAVLPEGGVLGGGLDGGVGASWVPTPGSGKHTHLNGGQGLVNGVGGGFEPGWVASDDQFVVPTDDSLTTDCKPANFATWTPAAGSNENLPIDCVTWQAAYAFCIWDGGFLPSEAEWNCAVAGGDQQRLYPWGSTPPGTASQYAIYDGYYPTGTLSAVGATAANIAPVGTATLGAGLWGQLDLEGNMSEMFLDTASTATTFYARSCNDCAYFTPGAVARVVSTSMFDQGPAFLESGDTPSTDILSADGFGQTVQGGGGAGFRCARTP